MNLNQLSIFVTVVERKGFSSASRILKLSPTAVSKQVKSLEDLLGVQLVLRTSTKFEMTEVGDLFYAHCKRILKDVENLEEIVQSFQSEPTGRLSVFSTAAFCESYLMGNLQEFVAQHPKILINLDVGDRFPDVQKEGIDLCFGLQSHWDEDLIQKKLFSTSYGLFASPSYLKKQGEPKTKKDLAEHVFVCHSNRPDSRTVSFVSGGAIEVNPSICTNDHAALLSLAKSGLGIVMLYDFIAKALIDSGELKRVLSKEKMATVNYNVYYPPTNYMKPAARVFLDFILSQNGAK